MHRWIQNTTDRIEKQNKTKKRKIGQKGRLTPSIQLNTSRYPCVTRACSSSFKFIASMNQASNEQTNKFEAPLRSEWDLVYPTQIPKRHVNNNEMIPARISGERDRSPELYTSRNVHQQLTKCQPEERKKQKSNNNRAHCNITCNNIPDCALFKSHPSHQVPLRSPRDQLTKSSENTIENEPRE